MLKTLLSASLVASVALAGSPPSNTPSATCEARLEHCKALYGAAKDVIAAQDKQTEALKKAVQDLNKQLETKRDPKFLEFIPTWVWIGAGAAFGLYIGTQVRR